MRAEVMTDELNIDNQKEIVEKNNEKETITDESVKSPSVKDDVPVDIIDLPHGKALTMDETYKITSSRKVKFIVLAGPSDSGKTTLVTTIYHMFQKGSLAGYWFAGSETLWGFEQRAYLTRISSGNASSQTPKTRRGISDAILHLRLCSCKSNVFQDLLITDFSGEDYKSVIGNVDFARSEFGVIKRADNIVLFIDGDLISQKSYRNGVELESLELLQTISDADLISNNTYVDILISKYDLVLQRETGDPSIRSFINNLIAKFNKRFSSHLGKLMFLNVAAMPDHTASLEIGHGLKSLIQNWVECDDKSDNVVQDDIRCESISEFNLFSNRAIGIKG